MTAAWGGHTFVLNMVGLHAALLCVQLTPLAGFFSLLTGFGARPVTLSAKEGVCGDWRDPTSLNRAFSLFYVLGTVAAIQVPVVGFAPLKSLEQLMPMAVFIALQLLQVNAGYMKKAVARGKFTHAAHFKFLCTLSAAVLTVGVALLGVLVQIGYLGPLSSRVRGLFVRHTRTGNPLVDSVAEHQSTRPEMYYA